MRRAAGAGARAALLAAALAALLGACSGPGSELREARQRTVCAIGDDGWRLDLVPGPDVHLSLRAVTDDPETARRELRRRLDRDEPSGVARLVIAEPRPMLALVIDDLGLHPGQIAPLWALGQSITWALLPHTEHATTYARWLAESGASMLVHLPMEPDDPRHMTLPGYVRMADSAARVGELVDQAFEAIPGAVGINNHMGSRLTADRAAVDRVVAALPADAIVLDSRTAPESELTAAARRAGHPVAQRTVFLDNLREVDAILGQLDEALRHAQEHGSAVAIGHPYAETVEALRRFLAAHGEEVHLVPIERVTAPPTQPAWLARCPR